MEKIQTVTEDFLKLGKKKTTVEILNILLAPLFKNPMRKGLDSY